MELSNDQLEEAAYIFEKANGHEHSEYEQKLIDNSDLKYINSEDLERMIVYALDTGIYDGTTDRISAYWALGKRFNEALVPAFKKWLQKEVELNDAQAVYQLLISLGNIGESVFNPDREGGSAYWESDLNMRDAKDYLSKNSA